MMPHLSHFGPRPVKTHTGSCPYKIDFVFFRQASILGDPVVSQSKTTKGVHTGKKLLAHIPYPEMDTQNSQNHTPR